MRRVAFFTSGRWDFSYLSPLFDDMEKLQFDCVWFVLTQPDSSFLESFSKSNLAKSVVVPLTDFSSSRKSMSDSLVDMQSHLTKFLGEEDLIYAVLLGDRAEIFATATILFYLDIPFAHLGAGDTTRGAIDDNFRHAISSFADTHFAFSPVAFELLSKTQLNSNGIFLTDPPHFNRILQGCESSESQLSEITNFPTSEDFVLATFHIETKTHISIVDQVRFIEKLLTEMASFTNIVLTGPNGDPGSNLLLHSLEKLCGVHSNIHFFNQLGEPNYWKVLRGSYCLIGNSSSGVYEAPIVGTPVINIGGRQDGRTVNHLKIDFDWNKSTISRIVEQLHKFRNSRVNSGKLVLERKASINIAEQIQQRIEAVGY